MKYITVITMSAPGAGSAELRACTGCGSLIGRVIGDPAGDVCKEIHDAWHASIDRTRRMTEAEHDACRAVAAEYDAYREAVARGDAYHEAVARGRARAAGEPFHAGSGEADPAGPGSAAG